MTSTRDGVRALAAALAQVTAAVAAHAAAAGCLASEESLCPPVRRS